ncbi:MAG TPA: FtsX-like permease family protein [Steroidobacteraceae bacterium]|jgi:putative ABC transport system permease protein|nr:FtsX-like permease family protein [Steroidobacteraceae bacterium]
MRHNKGAVGMIALQIGLTLAIICNALFIIEQRLAFSERPSGVSDEADVFVIENQWRGHPSDLPGRVGTDLAALRSLPGVVDATVSSTYPLGGPIMGLGITLHPDQPRSGTAVAAYLADQYTLPTLGLRLIAGRNFRPDEITDQAQPGIGSGSKGLSGVIVSRASALKLDPSGNVIGRVIVLEPSLLTAPIIGVVARLQGATPAPLAAFAGNSMLVPYRLVGPYAFYLVHSKPGQTAVVMRAAQRKLFQVSRARAIVRIQTLAEARRVVYSNDRGLALALGLVCAALLAVTAWGIIGLSSYWVTQRRRQIGIRRALGGTRLAIVRYFQTENLLITVMGIVVGIGVAIGGNLWMVSRFALPRMDERYLLVGAAIVLVLGQLAVLWPALRAASVPPAEATRTV